MIKNLLNNSKYVILQKEDTYKVKSIDSYDTFTDGNCFKFVFYWYYEFYNDFFLLKIDATFFRYIKTDVNDGDIILIASYDEMSNGYVHFFCK